MSEDSSYIILEEISSNFKIVLGCFILNFNENKILTVGRSPANDMIIEGESISRNHAVFQHKNDKFYLLDR